MAIAFSATTTHTKTLVNPTSGTLDKVYGSDYVSASSHTTSVSLTGLTANALLLSDGTDLTQSANLTYDTATKLLSVAGVSLSVGATIPSSGVYLDAGGYLTFLNGVAVLQIESTNGVRIRNDSVYGFSSSPNPTGAFDTAISRISAGLIGVGTGAAGSFAGNLKLTNTQNVGYQELDEMTAPAGAANSARLFTQDNGAGKTQLMAIFGSGAAQQLAIEA